MEPAKRIVINTLAQHTRAIINICLSLYSTRLVLLALGQSDFGIFSLVGGVVAMLAFLTNAMVVTTQRQLSFWHGKGDAWALKSMFSTSLLLHIVIGVALGGALLAVIPFVFDGFLDIPADRVPTAKSVYFMAVLAMVITFLTAPYKALFIAREEIVYVSVVEIMDGVLKLAFALCLPFITYDRLMAYACAIAGIMAFNYLALALWSATHFSESMLLPRLHLVNRQNFKELTGFATWTIYSMGCVVGRSQGVAIILNRFFGTVINSAYGIAQQVYSSVSFMSKAIVNAMSPQIVKAEACNDRQRMLHLAESSSKYAFLLLAIIAIPLIFEMPEVLTLWLGEVPEHTVTFCRFIIIASLCDQTTLGLATANQAIGRIRNFSLTINSIKVLTLPAFWLCLWLGYGVTAAMWVYFCFEVFCAAMRLPFLKYTAGLSIRHFVSNVFGRVLIPSVAISAVCYLMVTYVELPFRFLLTGVVTVVTAAITIWFFALDDAERQAALKMIRK